VAVARIEIAAAEETTTKAAAVIAVETAAIVAETVEGLVAVAWTILPCPVANSSQAFGSVS
jgi:hypothetical protein